MNEREILETIQKLGRIAHHTPGRIRIKFTPSIIAHAKKLEPALARFSDQAKEIITSYRVNAPGLTVIIEYNSGILSPELWETFFTGEKTSIDDLLSLINQKEV